MVVFTLLIQAYLVAEGLERAMAESSVLTWLVTHLGFIQRVYYPAHLKASGQLSENTAQNPQEASHLPIHLQKQPADPVISAGKVHRFERWPQPILDIWPAAFQ